MSEPKHPGSIRVAVFGDSIVFGQGVDEDSTLAAQLEKSLKDRAAGKSWEVINAGIRGYNMGDYRIIFKPRIISLKPDLLVFVITEINDAESEHFAPRSEKIERWKNSWWSDLPFARPFIALPLAIEINRLFIEHVRGIYDPTGKDWPLFLDGLEDIINTCRKAGVPVILVTFPLLEDENPFLKERKQLQDYLTHLEVKWVDPRPVLSRHSARDLVVSKGDFHPNPKALSITAELLLEPILNEIKKTEI
jgi:lysophospholipase L1-like esterase